MATDKISIGSIGNVCVCTENNSDSMANQINGVCDHPLPQPEHVKKMARVMSLVYSQDVAGRQTFAELRAM